MAEPNRAGPDQPAFLENLQLLVENLSEVFWIRSADLRVLYYVSPAFERVWGRPVAELYEHPERWMDFVVPDDRARVGAAFDRFLNHDLPLDVEYRINRPDGDIRWIRVRGAKAHDATGRAFRVLGTVSDLTEQRQAEQALRRSEADILLRTRALEAAANAVVITNAQGAIQWVNAAFTRLTGYTADEVRGRNLRVLKSGQQPESVYRELWQTISSGEVWHGELINRRKDGGLFHEEMMITPLCGPDGVITHYIGIKQDITARKHAEAAIQELNRKLQVASRQAGMADVAIDVLHNAGNALNSVTVSAGVLAERLRDSRVGTLSKLAGLLHSHENDLAAFLVSDPTGRRVPAFLEQLAAALVEEQGAMLAELANVRRNVEGIAETLHRQEALARTTWATETVAVNELVEDALRLNVDALTGHDIQTHREFEAQPTITTDRHKATQILLNLVRNARRACDLSGRADKRVIARVSQVGDRVRIAISDNGVGLAPEELSRIFGQDFPARRGGYGTGLHGDATAAVQLGGSLSGESAGPGCGATFVLELPCAQALPAP